VLRISSAGALIAGAPADLTGNSMNTTRVKALRSFVYQGVVSAGDVVEVPSGLAAELIANAKAVKAPAVDEPAAEAPRARRRAAASDAE
jgi:hypothetical protein